MGSKGFLFENHENRKWHQKPTFQKSSALWPSKNGPQERFWTNMKNRWKNDRKINGFGWSKTIEKYWKTNTFLDLGHSKKQWKIDAKMAPQRYEKMSKMEPGGGQDRFILRFYRFLEKAKKLDFSMRFRGDQKTRNIDPWSNKCSKKRSRAEPGGRTGRQGGPSTRV